MKRNVNVNFKTVQRGGERVAAGMWLICWEQESGYAQVGGRIFTFSTTFLAKESGVGAFKIFFKYQARQSLKMDNITFAVFVFIPFYHFHIFIYIWVGQHHPLMSP